MEDLGTVPNVQIITAAIAYDDPEAWHTYILFYHHALHILSAGQLCDLRTRPIHVAIRTAIYGSRTIVDDATALR